MPYKSPPPGISILNSGVYDDYDLNIDRDSRSSTHDY